MHEIERKFKVRKLPVLTDTPSQKIKQAYLEDFSLENSNPLIRRVRSIDDAQFFYTEKSEASADGLICKEEKYKITKKQFEKYLQRYQKGNLISKTRYKYKIPAYYQAGNKLVHYDYDFITTEIDVFEEELSGLVIVEVEFSSKTQAEAFIPPTWFGKEVTSDKRYRNKNLSEMDLSTLTELL